MMYSEWSHRLQASPAEHTFSPEFEALVAALPDAAAVVYPTGEIAATTPALAARFGRPPHDMAGTSLLDLLDPATRSAALRFLRHCLEDGHRRGSFTFELPAGRLRVHGEGTALNLPQDASRRLALVRFVPSRRVLAPARATAAAPATVLPRRRRSPRQRDLGPDFTEQQLREVLRRLPIAVYATDAEGYITYCNDAAKELAGREPQLGIDQWCVTWRLYRADGTPLPHEACPMAEALRTGQMVRNVEVIVERPDGTRLPIVPYPTPLHDASGRLTGAVNVLVDISERKQIEADMQHLNEVLEWRVEERTRQMHQAYVRLGESERWFRRLVDGVTDYALFMLDRDGVVSNWNSGAERIKGYKAHEIVGQHFSRFYDEKDRLAGIPANALATAAREGRFESEGWRIRKDGRKFWANAVIDAIRDEQGSLVGFAKITRDITERKRAQEALVESERMARAIVDMAFDAFVQMDEAGVIIEWNAQAQRLFGWPREEALGKPLTDLIAPPEDRPARGRELGRIPRDGDTAGAGRRLQWRALRRDGTSVTVELALTSLRFGERRLLNGFVRDLTQEIAAESQLRRAQRMEAVGQLTSGVAHDFNNLLTVIVGSLDLLNRWTLSEGAVPREKLLARLKALQNAVSRGERLTKQLLAFSRQSTLEPRVIAIDATIAGFVPFMQQALGEAIVVGCRLEAGEEAHCRLDPAQFEAALLNLGINARDAMPAGGRLTIETRQATVTARELAGNPALQNGPYLIVRVADTGCGMTPEVLEKAFDPFFTTKEIGKGTGLGLPQVWGFVTQSGGQIAIDSEPGKGTAVTLYLPQCADRPHDEEDETSAKEPCSGGRILIVDDDEDVRKVVAGLLEDCGYCPLVAASGEEALALLRSGAAVDLLFTDCVMPQGPAGADLARLAQAVRPGLPILLMTGYARTGGESTPDPGLYPTVAKPFSRSTLASRIAAALGQSPAIAPEVSDQAALT